MFFLLACFSTQSPSVSSKSNPTVQKTIPTTKKIIQQEEEIRIFLWNIEQQKLVPTTRSVSSSKKEQQALHSLYQGPLSSESSLSLLACGSTGAELLSLEDGLAKVQIQGNCSGCGSMTIYESIVATLKQLPSVDNVHVLDPQGKTQSNGDDLDARPACLNP